MNTKRIIVRAETLGYCMGVRRAVEIVYHALDSDTAEPIYTFGPIIHNNSVIKDLEKKGVRVLSNPEEGTGTVVIRAHGVGPEIKQELSARAVVLDATCPRVLSSQKTVSSYTANGYLIILVGDKNHGEVKGLVGFGENHFVVGTEDEAEAVPLHEKTLVIAQTTFERGLYRRICSVLQKRQPEIKIVDSICPATVARQSALKNLCRQVDALLVIGGKNSGNTRSLYQTAAGLCKNVWHIEDQEDIPEKVYDFHRIGLSAGASTPDWVIDAVEEVLITRE